MFQDQSHNESWHVAENEQRHAPYHQREIYHWYVAEQINSNMPTFNSKNAIFSYYMYSAEQIYVNYKIGPE